MLAEDAILARELGRLGGPGAKLLARFLATNVGEREVTVPVPADQVRASVHQAFGPDVEDELPDGSIRVRVGAGKMILNPTLVTFVLAPAPQELYYRPRAWGCQGGLGETAGR